MFFLVGGRRCWGGEPVASKEAGGLGQGAGGGDDGVVIGQRIIIVVETRRSVVDLELLSLEMMPWSCH
jgi:hypothetical protein